MKYLGKLFRFAFLLAFFCAVIFQGCNKKQNKMGIEPPIAKKIKKELTVNGDTRVDNYYWLNDRENPEVIDYLKAENAYTDSMMKHTTALQDKLYNEIVGRIKQTDMSVPYFENGYYFYTRYEEGKEYPIYCRKKGNLEAKEEVMLNVNEMAAGFSYYQVTGLALSIDNRILAYGVDAVSRRKYTIHFKDLTTGKTLDYTITNTTGNAVWANDNKTIFFSRKNETTLRPEKILRCKIGDPESKIAEVFFEADETYNTYIYKSLVKTRVRYGLRFNNFYLINQSIKLGGCREV